MKDFLPLGTVVLLKDTQKKLMIIGRLQICEGIAYKYSGVVYPEGYMGKDALFLLTKMILRKSISKE